MTRPDTPRRASTLTLAEHRALLRILLPERPLVERAGAGRLLTDDEALEFDGDAIRADHLAGECDRYGNRYQEGERK